MRNKTNLLTFILLTCSFLISCRGVKERPLADATEAGTDERQAAETVNEGSDQAGYLGTDESDVTFWRWTEMNKRLTGQVQIFAVEGERERKSESRTIPFEGVRDGESISLRFNVGLLAAFSGGTTLTGTLKGDELTLVAPNKSGNLISHHLKRGTVADYNIAVNALRGKAQQANVQAARDRETAAEAASIRKEIDGRQQAVENANYRMAQALSDLRKQVQLLDKRAYVDDILPKFDKASEKMRKCAADIKELAGRAPLSESGINYIESRLNDLESIKNSVESDVDFMNGRLDFIKGISNDLAEAVADVNGAWEGLLKAGQNNPTGNPKLAFTESDVIQARDDAVRCLNRGHKVMDDGRNKATSLNEEAKKTLQSATLSVRKLRSHSSSDDN